MKSRRGPTSLPIEQLEGLLGGLGVAEGDPAQHPAPWLHRRLGQLVGVHLAEPLVALDRLLVALALALQVGEHLAHLGLGVGVDDVVLLAAGVDDLDAVQRRDRGEHPAVLDQRAHVAVEQGEQQAPDVGAVDVGVGHQDDPAVAGRGRGRRCAPSRRRCTWMIAAHSAFLSMSEAEAFCTLRILPRIGSRAWCSELRASLAVPRAESPSTMNSSLRSTSSLRQSASLAGSDEVSSAFLRRCSSLCCPGRDPGPRGRGHLVEDRLGLHLAGLLRGGEGRLELLAHDRRHDPGGRRGAEHLLGLALELRLGEPDRDDRRHALEHVVLDDVVLGRPQHALGPQRLVERLGQRPLEALDVGAALGRRDDVDEGPRPSCRSPCPTAARRRPSSSRSTSVRAHVPLVVEHGDGLAEAARHPAAGARR